MQALPECEIMLDNIDDGPMPKTNLFNHYYYNLTRYIVPDQFHPERSYDGCANYYIVFAPLQNHHDSAKDIKNIEKYLRDKYKYERIVITREILEKRVHYNILMTTKANPILANGTIVQKFYLNIQHVANINHLTTIFDYMFKESKKRTFIADKDYYIYVKNH